MKLPQDIFIRNLESGILRENFFVSSIASIIIIRFYLFITGYPQIGTGGLHIAHVLFGGIFMLISFIMVFSFLDKKSMYIASILGGIGFGTFIDELGKFVTADNNYFYQPTIALIYVIFVLVYLAFKIIPKYPVTSEKEYVINAIDLTKEAVINDLDIDEEKRAMYYLQHADHKNRIVSAMHQLLDAIEAIPAPKATARIRLKEQLRQLYRSLAAKFYITKFIVFLLLLQAIVVIANTVFMLLNGATLPFHEWGKCVSAVAALIAVVSGLGRLHRSRVDAFKHFKIAALIYILLMQFFVFYGSQFDALFGLLVNVALLILIDYVLLMLRETITPPGV